MDGLFDFLLQILVPSRDLNLGLGLRDPNPRDKCGSISGTNVEDRGY